MAISVALVEEMVVDLAGNEALRIYKELAGKENVSELILADTLEMGLNQIRNILYKFDAKNLVSSYRKKDRKKGWYIYFWTFRDKEAESVVKNLKEGRLKKLKSRLKREAENNFYLCPNKCTRSTLENAMESQFRCVDCGKLLNMEDNSKTIKNLERQIKKLEKELSQI